MTALFGCLGRLTDEEMQTFPGNVKIKGNYQRRWKDYWLYGVNDQLNGRKTETTHSSMGELMNKTNELRVKRRMAE